jgi:hypothetical protein
MFSALPPVCGRLRVGKDFFHVAGLVGAAKFRSEVYEAASETFNRVRAALMKNPKAACADYGDTSVAHGLLRRY